MSAPYTVIRRSNLRSIRIIIREDGRVIVRAPKSASERKINTLVESKKEWIEQGVAHMKQHQRPTIGNEYPYEKYRMRAHKFIMQKVRAWNEIYRHNYERITIRNQSSRWGSCSSKKTLSFSYKLLFLPEELADYVVVHELCHLIEMNHSVKFWLLVKQAIPEYKKRRHELRRYSLQ